MRYFIVFLSVCVLSSCTEFSKVQKSADLNLKFTKAKEYYEKGDYVRANVLLKELMGLYKGTNKGEEIYYMYAKTQYEGKDYYLAGYYFRRFIKNYPNSKMVEECDYMSAYCYYLTSPTYSLDQKDTRKAISEFQRFINRYPESDRVAKCNDHIDELRGKLEKKSYEVAKQYFYVGYYKASIYAFENTLKEFPATTHKEELNFLIVKANYLLAENSIDAKKEERYRDTIEQYLSFIDKYTTSKYLKEAKEIFTNATKKIKSI